MKIKLLIVSHYFPPLNKMASLRPYAWAKYWSRMGHEVGVLTTVKEPYEGPSNLEIDLAERSVRIEEVPYLSLRKYTKSPNYMSVSAQPKMKDFLKRAFRFIGIDPFSPHLWIAPAVRRAYALYSEWPYDVIVSTFGPPACHIIASKVKKKLPVFWVADYRDLWYGSSLLTGYWPFSWFEKQIEYYFVKRADLITTVSEPWKDMLSKRFGDKVITIENGFDVEDLSAIEQGSIFPDDGKIRFVYTGTYYPERQDPEPIFKALERLKRTRLPIDEKIEIIFYGVKRIKLQKLIVKYNLDTIIKTPGVVDRKTALQAQRDANMLIFLDWLDTSFKGMLTGKLFEYLYAGTPVLCIGSGSDTSAVRLIKEAGIGFTVGMSDKMIRDIIEKLLSGEKLSYSPSPEILAKYTKEKLSEKMLEKIIKRL